MTRSAAAAALVATLALGCAWHSNSVEPGYEGAPGVETFLLLSPNVALALPAELQRGSSRVSEALSEYLTAQGRDVEHVGLYEGRRAWRRALARAKEEGAIDATPLYFSHELSELVEEDFDAIVMPSIVLRKVYANMGSARWDGVSRSMPIVNAPSVAAGGRNQSLFAQGAQLGGVTGEVMVSSLHFMVYTAEGERVFEGTGGLEFIHQADLVAAPTWTYQMVLRDDLFKDREVLEEGIETGLDPYLTPP